MIGAAIILGEASRRRYLPVFQAQPRFIPPSWSVPGTDCDIELTGFRFAFFQATSAYTNTGTSLSDLSMIPFQGATAMILVMFFLILAGNTAFVRLSHILVPGY